MASIFFKHKLLTAGIIVLLLLSIICQIVTGVIYQKLIGESDSMPTTENRLLKQCKFKFSNCYKLNGRMINTSVFVDKFILKIRICGLSLQRLTHLAGQLMMLSVVLTGVMVCLSLAAGDTLFQIIPYYLFSILGLYLYFSISGIVDLPGKKNLLKTNLVDYLENHMMPRLEIERNLQAQEPVREVRREVIFQSVGEPKRSTASEAKGSGEEEKRKGQSAAEERKRVTERMWASEGKRTKDGGRREKDRAGEQEELENLLGEFLV